MAAGIRYSEACITSNLSTEYCRNWTRSEQLNIQRGQTRQLFGQRYVMPVLQTEN